MIHLQDRMCPIRITEKSKDSELEPPYYTLSIDQREDAELADQDLVITITKSDSPNDKNGDGEVVINMIVLREEVVEVGTAILDRIRIRP